MKILVLITTHKRPQWCLQLLKDLKQQSGKYEVKVGVFHDRCDTDYSQVNKFCQDNGWDYFRTKENFGKWRFWELLNFVYQYADTQQADYVITLPDDCIPVQNFYKRAIDLLSPDHPLINFFTMNIHTSIYGTVPHYTIRGQRIMLSNWVDGCFVADAKFIKGMQILLPAATRKRMPMRGTGIAHELIRWYGNKEIGLIGQSYYALVEHIGNIDTVMHDARRRQELYGYRAAHELASSINPKDKDYIISKMSDYGIS